MHEIFKEGWQWASQQIIKFLVAIRIRDTDPDPYRDTDRTCLGEGMHCLSASRSFYIHFHYAAVIWWLQIIILETLFRSDLKPNWNIGKTIKGCRMNFSQNIKFRLQKQKKRPVTVPKLNARKRLSCRVQALSVLHYCTLLYDFYLTMSCNVEFGDRGVAEKHGSV